MKQDEKVEALYLENQICFPLYAASRLTTKAYAPWLKSLNITYPQYLVLLVLWKEKEKTVNELGQVLLLESNTLTPLLKRLEQKELIRRQRSTIDERRVLISLTEKGEALKLEACSIPEKIQSSFNSEAFSEQEIDSFKKTLMKLLKVLGE